MSLDDLCVQDLVQKQASETPEAVAVVSGCSQLTYRELNEKADVLAQRLRSMGVGPEIPVGLCVERSLELPITALAILKAGGAYVALDPADPPQRLAALLEDSGASVIVVQANVVAKLPVGKWQQMLITPQCFEEPPDDKTNSGAASTAAQSSNVAYVIFTSGSTGKPKGVQVTHDNLLNLVNWHNRAFTITSEDRATLQASPGFDAAVWELWPYLVSGATVHVVPDAVRTEPKTLQEWIVRNGITIGFFPTQLAECLMAQSWPAQSAFRTLLTGADALRRRPSRELPFAVINNYGPTECTVVATSGVVEPADASTEVPSIGRAIDNVNVYIVDEKLQRVPDGEAGEILIGGEGVARGYLNAQALTAEKFIRDPFSSKKGARLYRTGDLGRILPDGQIAFMGRIDDQIKVMGHRIEPQEVMRALDRHPDVAGSYVCGYADPSGVQRLVAYIVSAKSTPPKPREIRDFLGGLLPAHMVPSAFVPLAQLPTSTHGKLDRASLPQPTQENMLREDFDEAPLSPLEEHLTSLVSGLLGGTQVGAHDNFFTLGGHSLLGAQLIARIRESFGVEISLRTLFEEPTVHGMAAEIEKLIQARIAAMSDEEAERLLASSNDGD